MKFFHQISVLALSFGLSVSATAQDTEAYARVEKKNESPVNQSVPTQKVVIVTGARFSYELVQKWIDDYNKVNPDVQIIVESRGSNDPLKFDILAEVYEQPQEVRDKREYINVGRYAVLPVATATSSFAKVYGEQGLNEDVIKQVFFNDIFADQERQKPIKAPFTVYTRMQKAGVPIVFAKYFGFEQKDIKGNGIAGADSHLIKALLRDSTGVTYLPTPLIYDKQTRKPIEGLAVLPVDVNGNGKVNDSEKFFNDLDAVLSQLENAEPKDIENIPIEYLHLSVDKEKASPEAVQFLKWVNENGQETLHSYGYLKPEVKRFEKEKFNEFASKRGL
jgi:phosphate transport system substrate-binding protein